MLLSEAKQYIGKVCSVRYKDRLGNELLSVSKIYDATFVPLYGGYLITEQDDIRLDRISEVCCQVEMETSETFVGEKVAA